MRFHRITPAFLVLLALTCGCNNSTPQPTNPQSTAASSNNATEASQALFQAIEFAPAGWQYQNGEQSQQYSILESLGGGVSLTDFDRDGRLDVVLAGGGNLSAGSVTPLDCLLLHNRSVAQPEFKTTPPGVLPAASYYNHGISCCDVDNDGFADLLISGYGGVQLLRNQGDGTFTDITAEAGLADNNWSSSTAWGDFNHDGFPDLYVAHYVNWSWDVNPPCQSPKAGQRDVCSPNEFEPLNDILFVNQGDWTFRSEFEAAGLTPGGKGLGVLTADLNDDGQLDIYVANDTVNNFLYSGNGELQFQEIGMTAGVALDGNGAPNGSMGIALFDFDGNLKPDLWVTNYENESIAAYQNIGDNLFSWASDKLGLSAIGRTFVAFGIVARDFNCDGFDEVAVANGHVILFPSNSTVSQVPLYFQRGKGMRMARTEFTPESYFGVPHRGRGVVAGDVDGDGDLDMLFSNVNESPRLLVNSANGRNFHVDLVGTRDCRDAIGASATLETNLGKYCRWVVGGGSYISQNPYRLTWGLRPDEQPRRLTVQWIDSAPTQLESISDDQLIVVQQ